MSDKLVDFPSGFQNNFPKGLSGLGLRRSLFERHLADKRKPDFWELAPENWVGIGGSWRESFETLVSDRPIICHGLSLSIGGPDHLDESLLTDIRDFLDHYKVAHYSEHCSYAAAKGQVYELLPIPFDKNSANRLVEKIVSAQQILGRQISIENVSYYLDMKGGMKEADFICEVLEQADCLLLLDVNNLWCNYLNHGTDPHLLMDQLPVNRVSYFHVAGHTPTSNGLVIDTHGMPVIRPVWDLLQRAYQKFGVKPTVLERDSGFPALDELFQELDQIKNLQNSPAPA